VARGNQRLRELSQRGQEKATVLDSMIQVQSKVFSVYTGPEALGLGPRPEDTEREALWPEAGRGRKGAVRVKVALFDRLGCKVEPPGCIQGRGTWERGLAGGLAHLRKRKGGILISRERDISSHGVSQREGGGGGMPLAKRPSGCGWMRPNVLLLDNGWL